MKRSVFWKAYFEGSVENGCDGKRLGTDAKWVLLVHVLEKPWAGEGEE